MLVTSAIPVHALVVASMALLSFSGTRCDEMKGSIWTTSILLSLMVPISASTVGIAIVTPSRV